MGRTIEEKGIIKLLYAFKKLEKISPQVRLLIFGSSWFSQKIQIEGLSEKDRKEYMIFNG